MAGRTGDLYVEIVVREHPIFERDGAHLSCEVPVSFTTAALGGSVEVPTLEGQANIKVPAGTQSGRVFRLREKGIKPVRGGATGDLFCRVVVETPVDLGAEQKELLRKFEGSLAADGKRHNPRQRSWLEGVRQFFGQRWEADMTTSRGARDQRPRRTLPRPRHPRVPRFHADRGAGVADKRLARPRCRRGGAERARSPCR